MCIQCCVMLCVRHKRVMTAAWPLDGFWETCCSMVCVVGGEIKTAKKDEKGIKMNATRSSCFIRKWAMT